jgi:exodeoxyribonuclease-3
MRITTWNVNGLRAVLAKGAWDWVKAQAPDVVCLQEIKARPEQLGEIRPGIDDGYQALWHPAERPGYSGVATFSRQTPESFSLGLGFAAYDVEGRVIRTQQRGIHLFNIYFPNGKRDKGRLTYKLDFYSDLLKLCDRMHASGEQIIICGDFNTAHNEIDLANPKENSKISGFLPEERAWLDLYLEHGFKDAYRELYPERVEYTWWTYRVGARQRNIGWRLDFFFVSDNLMERVEDVRIHAEVPGSDHCPVTLALRD